MERQGVVAAPVTHHFLKVEMYLHILYFTLKKSDYRDFKPTLSALNVCFLNFANCVDTLAIVFWISLKADQTPGLAQFLRQKCYLDIPQILY
jgi:hypothetical protein